MESPDLERKEKKKKKKRFSEELSPMLEGNGLHKKRKKHKNIDVNTKSSFSESPIRKAMSPSKEVKNMLPLGKEKSPKKNKIQPEELSYKQTSPKKKSEDSDLSSDDSTFVISAKVRQQNFDDDKDQQIEISKKSPKKQAAEKEQKNNSPVKKGITSGKADFKTVADDGSELFMGWQKSELIELFDRMSQQIPKNDLISFTSRVKRIDWEKVAFDEHTGDESEKVWAAVQPKMRKFRLLNEVLSDAREWADTPWMNMGHGKKIFQHPDMPKKPLSAYFLFSKSKIRKYKARFPNMTMGQLAKIIVEKYKELPEEKKSKYIQKANQLKLEYAEKLEQFKREHPFAAAKSLKREDKTDPDKKKLGSNPNMPKPPERPRSPFKFYVLAKAGDTSKEHSEELKDIWKNLSDRKKAPWIRKAIEEEEIYFNKVEAFKEEHPEVEIPLHKSVISKEERKTLERADGKPEDPPMTAYALFRKVILRNPEIKSNFPNLADRSKEVSRIWQTISKEEKVSYAKQVKQMKSEYLAQYADYLNSLPEDKKMAELAEGKLKKMHALDMSPAGRKLKQMTISELLNKKKGTVLEEIEEEHSEEDSDDDDKFDKLGQLQQKIIMSEPPPPPTNDFELFKSVNQNKGLSEKKLAKVWNKMLPNDRLKYKQKLAEVKQKYLIKYRAFLQSLNEKELAIYQELKKSRKANQENKEKEDSSESEEEVTVKPQSKKSVPDSVKLKAAVSSSSEETSDDS